MLPCLKSETDTDIFCQQDAGALLETITLPVLSEQHLKYVQPCAAQPWPSDRDPQLLPSDFQAAPV